MNRPVWMTAFKPPARCRCRLQERAGIPREHGAHGNRTREKVHRDFRFQVIRHEEPAEQERAEACRPFVTAHRESVGSAGGGETDEVFARDVGENSDAPIANHPTL